MIGPTLSARLPARRIAASLALLLGVGLALGWTFGRPPAPGPGRTEADDWSLPQARPAAAAPDIALLRDRRPWGGPSAADQAEAEAAAAAAGQARDPWRLAGIVYRGSERFALIAIGPAAAPRLEYRRPGETLPDGSRLIRLTPDSAVTETAAGAPSSQHTYRLFRNK